MVQHLIGVGCMRIDLFQIAVVWLVDQSVL